MEPIESAKPALSKRLRAISVVLEFGGILGAALLGGFIGGGVMIAVFYFLEPRSTIRRARIGIAISLLPALGLPLMIYGHIQLMNEAAELEARWEGVASPEFSFVTLDGDTIDSNQLRGKRVLLNFWATWCPPCRMEIPEINRLYTAADGSDVAVFGVSSEDESTIREFLTENPVDYPMVSIPDHRLPAPFDGVVAVPTSFVIDRNGVIQFIHSGYVDGDVLEATVWDAGDYQGVAKSAPVEDVAG